MLEKLKKPDMIGWLKWMWTSQMGIGLIFFLLAALEKDYVIGVLASSMIVGYLAGNIDRNKHRTLKKMVFWIGKPSLCGRHLSRLQKLPIVELLSPYIPTVTVRSKCTA